MELLFSNWKPFVALQFLPSVTFSYFLKSVCLSPQVSTSGAAVKVVG